MVRGPEHLLSVERRVERWGQGKILMLVGVVMNRISYVCNVNHEFPL